MRSRMRVAVGHEDEGGATGISGDREDGEAASEEGVGRVGYLDLFGGPRAGC